MDTNRLFRRLILAASAACLAATPLLAGTDEGMARFVPWSGSYWPIRQGLMIRGPLSQYDRVTGRQAARWEWENNPPGPQVPAWYGYCHAWASAAVMDREPVRLRHVGGLGGEPVRLGVGDQKGMLTACHTNDVAQHYGLRFTGAEGEDSQDLYPDELWRVLRLYLREQGLPLIMDIEAGPEVWNYPVFAYRVAYRPTGRGGEHLAELSLWMADDAVPPGYVGVKVVKGTYYFSFNMQRGLAQAGSGRWIGPSVRNHPDFAWYPQVAVANNPEIDYGVVRELVDRSGAGSAGGSPFYPQGGPGSGRPPLPPQFLPPQPGETPNRPQDQSLPISPLELLSVVVHKTSSFDLDVTVDKFDGGQYDAGEPLVVSGTSAREGYLHLFYLDNEGRLAALFPPPGVDNKIPAQRRFRFPAADSGYTFRAFPSPGTHRIKAVVTSVPLGTPGNAQALDETGTPAKFPPEFHLPPSQKSYVKDVLDRYRQSQPIGEAELGSTSPRVALGEFAQDEVAFYVGPPARREGGPP